MFWKFSIFNEIKPKQKEENITMEKNNKNGESKKTRLEEYKGYLNGLNEEPERKRYGRWYCPNLDYSVYLISLGCILLHAEEHINSVKKSMEWKHSFAALSSYAYRGIIESSPTKKNGYSINILRPDSFHKEECMEYVNSVREDLIDSERTAEKVRKSRLWKNMMGYFRLRKKEGVLKEIPSSKNNYQLVFEDGAVQGDLWEDWNHAKKIEHYLIEEALKE